jgi:predicted ester cyclase
MRGTHHGELMGVSPTGKSFELTGISIYRLAASRIAEEWRHYDMGPFMSNLKQAL